jgi:hypothetical protein
VALIYSQGQSPGDLNTSHQALPPNTVALEIMFLTDAFGGHNQTTVSSLVLILIQSLMRKNHIRGHSSKDLTSSGNLQRKTETEVQMNTHLNNEGQKCKTGP